MGDASDPIIVYISSVSSNREIKEKQQRIEMILESKKIPFERVDVAASEDDKLKMREIVGDEKALPPRICKGQLYLGDYAAFDDAVENEDLSGFLKLSS